MPGASDRPRGRRKAQTLGMALAVLLGTAAVGLAVLGTTQKQVQIGLILGLWAALIGLITMFGIRRRTEPAVVRPVGMADDRRGRELLLRSDAANRREYEKHLHALVRSEIGRAVQDEMDTLRSEVAALRSDLVEKVHGQLQLERIETTRVIGSDLEALQHEVRRLAVAGNVGAGGRPALDYRPSALNAEELSLPAEEPAERVATQATTLLPRMDPLSRPASATFAPSTKPSSNVATGSSDAASSNGIRGFDDGIRSSPALPPVPAPPAGTLGQMGLAPSVPADHGDHDPRSTPAAPTSSTPTSPASLTPATPTPATPTPATPTPATPTPATPTPAFPMAASPTPASPTPASPTAASPAASPMPATAGPGWERAAEEDPFAALPRLGHFVMDDPDLPFPEDRRRQVDVPAPGPQPSPPAEYVGRRRAVGDDSERVLRRYELSADDRGSASS